MGAFSDKTMSIRRKNARYQYVFHSVAPSARGFSNELLKTLLILRRIPIVMHHPCFNIIDYL